MNRVALIVCLVFFACAVPVAPCRADDDLPSSRAPASSFYGLSGYEDLIDGRVAGSMQFGAGVNVGIARIEGDGTLGATEVDLESDGRNYTLRAGLGLFDLVEVGIMVPFLVDLDIEIDPEGPGPKLLDENESGFGDVLFSLKGGVEVDLSDSIALGLSAYALLEAPTGDEDVGADTAEAELGGAVTLSIYDVFAIHGNAAFHDIEGGTQLFEYRVGISVSLGVDSFTLRAFVFADGTEFEGSVGSDIEITAGAQAFILEILFAEVSADYLVYEESFEDIDVEGSWAFQAVLGVAF